MVKLYIKSIIKGRIKFSQVPSVYQNDVKKGLEERVTSGEITEQQLLEYLKD